MSAYIVDDKTMQQVVRGWMKEFDPLLGRTRGDDVGRMLYALNVGAVNYRYDEDNAVPDFQWHDFRDIVSAEDNARVYKAIQCLSYQCCEGEIPENALYQTLERLCDIFAHRCARETSVYKQLPWG